MAFVRLKIRQDGQNHSNSPWDCGQNGDEEWAFNTDQIVAWKGKGKIANGGWCILKLTNGNTIEVEAGEELLQILTGTHPSVVGNNFPK